VRVLVAREEHGERIILADTDEQLAVAALKLLLERWDQGWYEDPDGYWEYREEPPYTQEQVDALPERSRARYEAENQNETWERVAKKRKGARQFYAYVKAVAENRDDPEVVSQRTALFTGRIARKDPSKPFGGDNIASPFEPFPSTWAALVFRRDHEYEFVELRDLEQPEG
jgi:hypothetical protein